jgi:hypothetical protein
MPSLGHLEMRHGRKARTRPFTGYNRHLTKLLGPELIVGASVRPANEPTHRALEPSLPTVAAHSRLAELFVDRGYPGSPTVAALDAAGTATRAKA